jgi:hypothetical protein
MLHIVPQELPRAARATFLWCLNLPRGVSAPGMSRELTLSANEGHVTGAYIERKCKEVVSTIGVEESYTVEMLDIISMSVREILWFPINNAEIKIPGP